MRRSFTLRCWPPASGCATAVTTRSPLSLNRLPKPSMAAGALDSVENAALLGMLNDVRGEGLPRLAFGCAAAKFALLGVGGLYLLAAFLRPLQTSQKARHCNRPRSHIACVSELQATLTEVSVATARGRWASSISSPAVAGDVSLVAVVGDTSARHVAHWSRSAPWDGGTVAPGR